MTAAAHRVAAAHWVGAGASGLAAAEMGSAAAARVKAAARPAAGVVAKGMAVALPVGGTVAPRAIGKVAAAVKMVHKALLTICACGRTHILSGSKSRAQNLCKASGLVRHTLRPLRKESRAKERYL